jgi:ABC-type glycerol-3-phosphate transport system substrate-binding protein
MNIFKYIKAYFAVIVVVGTIAWAVFSIATRQVKQIAPGIKVIRIAHWQLESGVRDGIDEMARQYEILHPDVKIVQEGIPESVYGQWVTTQLMGGTAPDLMEEGLGLNGLLWTSYYNRYFLPLNSYVTKANPYNKGTNLEGVPFRMTIEDGMKNAYNENIQQFVGIQLSQFSMRLFYNKDLLKKLTGLDESPKEYRGFLAACKKIKSQKNSKGQVYIPIASSRYHFPTWEGFLFDMVTPPILDRADFNRDGTVGMEEYFAGFKTGLLTPDYPAFKARFQMMREVADNFQPGWTGLGRDEAVFLFAQQRAVFISTGTWDYMSLKEQAKGKFNVGVVDFPLPTQDDPVYGRFIRGPRYETVYVGFQFGVTRTSKYPDIAIDFMLFMASQKKNEELNNIIGWIPGTKGAKLDADRAQFKPHLYGCYGVFNTGTFQLGGNTTIKWMQDYSAYQVGKYNYKQMINSFLPFYLREGLKDQSEQQRDGTRGLRQNEQLLAGIRAKGFYGEGETAASAQAKYIFILTGRQIVNDITRAQLLKTIEDGPLYVKKEGPYEYSKDVLNKIREHLKKK